MGLLYIHKETRKYHIYSMRSGIFLLSCFSAFALPFVRNPLLFTLLLLLILIIVISSLPPLIVGWKTVQSGKKVISTGTIFSRKNEVRFEK